MLASSRTPVLCSPREMICLITSSTEPGKQKHLDLHCNSSFDFTANNHFSTMFRLVRKIATCCKWWTRVTAGQRVSFVKSTPNQNLFMKTHTSSWIGRHSVKITQSIILHCFDKLDFEVHKALSPSSSKTDLIKGKNKSFSFVKTEYFNHKQLHDLLIWQWQNKQEMGKWKETGTSQNINNQRVSPTFRRIPTVLGFLRSNKKTAATLEFLMKV